MTQGPCPPEQTLVAFVEGSASSADGELVRRHLATCESCFDLASTLAGLATQQSEPPDAALRARVITPTRARWVSAALTAGSVAAVFLAAVVWWRTPPGPRSVAPEAPAQSAAQEPVRSQSQPEARPLRVEQPRNGDTVGGPITVRWSGPAEATSYDVLVTSIAGELIMKRHVDNASHETTLDVTLPSGRRCYILVDAYMTDGRSLTSNAVEVLGAPAR